MVLVGDLYVLHKVKDNTVCRSKQGAVVVLYPAGVDFCIEDVVCLGLAQQESLDAPSDWLVAYVLLDGEEVLGGNHALVEAELLAGAVVAAKEKEHSVDRSIQKSASRKETAVLWLLMWSWMLWNLHGLAGTVCPSW